MTEKMDGENTNMYSDRIHARSIDSLDHPSRHYVKGLWGAVKYTIPEGWRICGENVYAKHSIFYEDLDSYFYVFSVWDENNVCLSWSDTEDFCEERGLITVPVLYTGWWNDIQFNDFYPKWVKQQNKEGFVIRTEKGFHYDDFNKHVVKWVRKGHVQTDQHWMAQKVVPNKLKKNEQ
jgi:hypothetical protein